MTALVRDGSGPRHLLYLNRVSADGVSGFLSGIRRFFIERRIKSGARGALEWMRRRIEGAPVQVPFPDGLESRPNHRRDPGEQPLIAVDRVAKYRQCATPPCRCRQAERNGAMA